MQVTSKVSIFSSQQFVMRAVFVIANAALWDLGAPSSSLFMSRQVEEALELCTSACENQVWIKIVCLCYCYAVLPPLCNMSSEHALQSACEVQVLLQSPINV